jgi:hypothetical protein
MNENELKEMEHIRFILSELQRHMSKLYGNESVAMDISTNGYRHCVNVVVWSEYEPYETDCTHPEHFVLAPWHSYDENERVWADIMMLLP